ncbi:MAG: nitrous oxide reductase accessory protein NosL [Rhodobacteraceae bacterium]|nr:nitrous oxide reductase accessory protein NosL [Paracoccaceae bacterium]
MKHLIFIAILALAACREEASVVPDPIPMTKEALGHYCQMNIADHGGPKGQIHLAGQLQPLFFAQARDVIAYLKTPEREAEITAVYVSDMGAALSWRYPGENNWIAADQAIYVIGAGVAGGMGAPEIVPFADHDGARAFIATYGGRAVTFEQIPADAALGPVDLDQLLETPA